MWVVVDHPNKKALDIFAREIAPAGTSWSPGTTMPAGGRPSPSPFVPRGETALAAGLADGGHPSDP